MCYIYKKKKRREEVGGMSELALYCIVFISTSVWPIVQLELNLIYVFVPDYVTSLP